MEDINQNEMINPNQKENNAKKPMLCKDGGKWPVWHRSNQEAPNKVKERTQVYIYPLEL